MKYSAKNYAEALVKACADKPKAEIKGLVDGWFDLIVSQRQTGLLPRIMLEIDKLYRADEMDVTVEAAKQIDGATKKWLAGYLSKITDKKIIWQEKVNPELLAGYLIKYQDKELELSLKGILNELRERIVA